MKIPTKDEVHIKLKQIDYKKYKNLRDEDITITESGVVRVFGRFAKGYSTNPEGRKTDPKLKKESEISKEDKKKIGTDSKKAFEYVLKKANTIKALSAAAKDLIKYQYPQLSNVESHSFEQKLIQIQWIDPGKDLIDMTQKDYDTQLEAAKKLEDVPEIEEVSEPLEIIRNVGEEVLEGVKSISEAQSMVADYEKNKEALEISKEKKVPDTPKKKKEVCSD